MACGALDQVVQGGACQDEVEITFCDLGLEVEQDVVVEHVVFGCDTSKREVDLRHGNFQALLLSEGGKIAANV